MSDFKIAFGKHLKILRVKKRLTQEKLAELVGLNPRQISKIETGEHFPSSTTIELFCLKLDLSPRILFDFDFLEQEISLASGYNGTHIISEKYNASIKIISYILVNMFLTRKKIQHQVKSKLTSFQV